MDNNEATSTMLSRIKSSQNGSKIVGYLLIKEIGEKEMIRLVLVKAEMAAASNTPSASPFIPIVNPNGPNSFAQSSPRIIVPINEFVSRSSYPRKINADGQRVSA
ncbi:hypothetical protein DCAR_0206579 [Daucus carota subsp. sativus]|uniref:AtC3H46-like PABC-like domain-containing protein n=1 Tax=Daucus carota subsp. sativus TaxID=79200 RepID=A0AAF0WFZ8_DAUCS|nr:hypothetical protein DCAR_0206579 [Daucus carota subsp. sativus]